MVMVKGTQEDGGDGQIRYIRQRLIWHALAIDETSTLISITNRMTSQ